MVLVIMSKWFTMVLNTAICSIAEAYALLKGGLALSNEELAQTFTEWNKVSSAAISLTSPKTSSPKKMKRVNTWST
jgi:hypothetical protein